MSLLSHDITHPACNRPDCHRSPFDLVPHNPFDWWKSPDHPALRSSFGNLADYLKPHFTELNKLKQETKIGDDGFQVCVDVQHFQPNEIEVKTENNTVIVHAKHEEKVDEHGYISREFTRRYQLPDEFKPENVVSSLSSDGVLMIKAPKPDAEGKTVHHIQVQQTGEAHPTSDEENKEGNKEEK